MVLVSVAVEFCLYEVEDGLTNLPRPHSPALAFPLPKSLLGEERSIYQKVI